MTCVSPQACLERKCYPSPLNYRGFPKSCCTSVNEGIFCSPSPLGHLSHVPKVFSRTPPLLQVSTLFLTFRLSSSSFSCSCSLSIGGYLIVAVICHGIPDSRKLEDGDICNVDITVYYKVDTFFNLKKCEALTGDRLALFS